MSTDHPSRSTTKADAPSLATSGQPAGADHGGLLGGFLDIPVPAPMPPKPPPVKPDGSDALWLFITLVNIALLLAFVPERWLKSEQVALFVKIVPVVVIFFAGGYLWFKQLIPVFLRHTSYKIFQTALLAVLLTLNISQLPVFPVYPKLEMRDVQLKAGTQTLQLNDGRLFLTFGTHTVIVSPPPDSPPALDEATYRVSYRDLFFGLFKAYRPAWPLHHKVYIRTFELGVRVEIRKTDGDFGTDYRNAPPATGWGDTTFTIHPEEKNVFVYTGKKADDEEYAGRTEFVWLPPGTYEFRNLACPATSKQDFEVVAGSAADYEVEIEPCAEE